jgi:hypothetical protein
MFLLLINNAFYNRIMKFSKVITKIVMIIVCIRNAYFIKTNSIISITPVYLIYLLAIVNLFIPVR